MSNSIEALYIYDELHSPILSQIYRGRPPTPTTVLAHYLAYPAPRPSLIYSTTDIAPFCIFAVSHGNLLFLSPTSHEVDPLFVLEYIHRVIDALEEFVGAPILPIKIQSNYDIVIQLMCEMCSGGLVSNTEPNALREAIEVPGWVDKLLGGVGLQNPGSLASATSSKPMAKPHDALTSIPWRRSNVRHTSNELYVDVIETLHVILAPSGRIISALANGTIVFTAKMSGVPELSLALTSPSGPAGIPNIFTLPVFHPCVRLAKWRESPGQISFIPPDGRFVLAGYEVDLAPVDPESDEPPRYMEKVFLPAVAELRKGLGPTKAEFEVRLTLRTDFPRRGGSGGFGGSTGGRGGGGGGPGISTTASPSIFDQFANLSGSKSTGQGLEDVLVTIPIPPGVRNITDIRASRGDATFTPGKGQMEWRVPTKDGASVNGTATLRCKVVERSGVIGFAGNGEQDQEADAEDEEEEEEVDEEGDASGEESENQRSLDDDQVHTKEQQQRKSTSRTDPLHGYYDTDSYQTTSATSPDHDPLSAITPATTSKSISKSKSELESAKPTPQNQSTPRVNAAPMPSSVSVSFTARGWTPSGIRVDGITVDTRRSSGLPEGVKPYKGVKYISVSSKGVERRC